MAKCSMCHKRDVLGDKAHCNTDPCRVAYEKLIRAVDHEGADPVVAMKPGEVLLLASGVAGDSNS